MVCAVLIRVYACTAIGVLSAIATSVVLAEQQYPFVAQQAGNRFDSYICAGLACSIESLEEGTAVEGVETAVELVFRLWRHVTDSNTEERKLVYHSSLRLRDGSTVPICSKSAIEEIGFLLQQEYKRLVNDKLWQVGLDADPLTPDGSTLLETRQKYLDIIETGQDYSITSLDSLKRLFNDSNDKDGLIALSGRGHRFFEKGTPQKVLDDHKLSIEPGSKGRSLWVPSNHAFLITHDKNRDRFFVYDPDDPDGKWPLTADGEGATFRMRWRIDDHMGNGPSHQAYADVRPLGVFLRDIRAIAEQGSVHVPQTSRTRSR